MTRCDRPREALLDADLDVLTGTGASELAAHVRTCGTCRAAARAILDATALLDAGLQTAGRPPDVDAILARARSEVVPATTSRRHAPSGPWLLAAAAAIAALMVLGRREPAAVSSPRPTATTPPLVEPAEGSDVAVIPTANPDITIVWFFQGG